MCVCDQCVCLYVLVCVGNQDNSVRCVARCMVHENRITMTM